MEEGKYLYCLIKENRSKKFKIFGLEGKEIYTICQNGIAMVVSDLPFREEFLATRENLLSHQKVMEEAMKEYDVLPISFGTIAKTKEEIIEKILKNRKRELKELFQSLEGRIELGLKTSWINMNSIFQEIAESSLIIQRSKKSKNINYQEKIAVGELVAKLLEKKKEAEKEKILEPLKRIAEDFRENKILGDDMILNAAFLVKKTKEKQFDREVNTLGKKFGQRIKLRYVGPLPPFNFVKFSF